MKAALPILVLVLAYSTQVSRAIPCWATLTSAGSILGSTPPYGAQAFPQAPDTFTAPDTPDSYKSCIRYKVYGGIVATSGQRVVFTSVVEGIDGQGVLNTCDELRFENGTLTRTGEMFTRVRYRPAQVWNFSCCEEANCNDGLSMLFTTINGAFVPFTSSIMLMFSALLGFLLIFRLV